MTSVIGQSFWTIIFTLAKKSNCIQFPNQANCMVTHSSTLSTSNRTEWSPIRSVIIRVVNRIGRPRSGGPICLITSIITDWIGRHEVLFPINHNFNKICDIYGPFFKIKTEEIPIFFSSNEKKPFKRARDCAYCPIT